MKFDPILSTNPLYSLAHACNAPASALAVELTAGELTPEHTNYVLSRFNREGKGFIDFMDLFTYVPLFVEIHQTLLTTH